MKTENQMVDKLEEVAKKLEWLTSQVNEDKATEEQTRQICTVFGMLCVLGWALDCEEELKSLLSKIRTVEILSSIKVSEKM